MKVTIENKKGLNKDLKVFIDKKTMSTHMDQRYEEIKGTVNLKGFRPGKVPKEILKRQFGKAVFGEVLDKVIKDTSTKALQENNIKPAGQPKLDLKTYGEDKDLEYIISVTELPKVEVKPIENIKFDEYSVKIDETEADKRIKEIAKNQPNFKEAPKDTIAKEGDLVAFDYNATIDDKPFKGGEGKNTQLTLGKDLFLKGFDKQLMGVKVGDEKIVEATLPENFPDEEVKILSQGMSEEDAKKSRKNFEEIAKKRIKVGLVLNEFGEQNQIKVTEQELQAEVQKQIRMMPGQEKMVMDFYQKNPSALSSLRGTVYEEKILKLIKEKAKPNKKEVSKEEAEKILKQSQMQEYSHANEGKEKTEKKVETKKPSTNKTKTKTSKTKSPVKKTKKVSKK